MALSEKQKELILLYLKGTAGKNNLVTEVTENKKE